MADLIKTKGIVLHEMTIKDHDKRLILFSKDYGKMIVFANGAKRAKSPLLAGTQPFIFGDFYVLEGRDSFTLRQVTIDESFFELRNDMNTLAYGLYLMEVINHVIQEMDPNEELLRLLYISLMALKNGSQEGGLVKTVFQFRSMNMLGFAPNLNGCIDCGQVNGPFVLSSKGGILCSGCKMTKKLVFDGPVLSVLRYIQEAPLKKLYHFKMDEALGLKVEKIVQAYFDHFVSGNFKSLDIINL